MLTKCFQLDSTLMKIYSRALPISVSMAILFFIGCEDKSPNLSVLATVDEIRITIDDFLREGQNIPLRRVVNIGASMKDFMKPQDILDLLIEMDILVQEAAEKGLDKTDRYKNRRRYEIEKQSRWELYYREIDSALVVSEEDTRFEYLRQNQQLRVYHLFSSKESGINTIQSRLDAGETFADIAKSTFSDTVLASNGGKLGWIKWGEWDTYFEEAAWNLKPSEISEPIRSTFGWHIIKVEDRKQNIFLTEQDYSANIVKLRDEVRRRKAEKYSNKFLNRLMLKKKPQIIKETFNSIASFVVEIKSRNKINFPLLRANMDPELKALSEEFATRLGDVLVTWNGGELTVKDFLDEMRINSSKGYNVTGALSLNHAIWRWLRNKLLAEEAISRGYHNSKRITNEIVFWHQNYMMNNLIFSEVSATEITETEISEYYEKNKEKYYSEPMVNVREILVSDENSAEEVLQKLEDGVDFSILVKEYSNRKWAAVNGGELGYFQSGQFKPLDKYAFSSKIGEIVGPIKNGSEFSIIEVIGKRGRVPIPLKEVKSRIRGEMLKQMEAEIYIKVVKRVRSKHKITINTELFRKEIVESERWSNLKSKISNLFIVRN